MEDNYGDEEEFCIESTAEFSEEDNRFDEIVGVLQDVLMDDEFDSLQKTFLQSNCQIFDDNEENKLAYTPIFKKWISTVEGFLNTCLTERIDNFSMEEFLALLSSREDQIEGPIFEMLLSFGDFSQFKLLMLDTKKVTAAPVMGFMSLCALSPKGRSPPTIF